MAVPGSRLAALRNFNLTRNQESRTMTAFHKALAAALLCGAVGFALPGHAQNADSSANTGTTAENGTANAPNATSGTTQAKEAKKPARARRAAAVRPKGGSEAKEHEIVENLNQQSLQAFESGNSSPSFTDTAAATQQATTSSGAKNTAVKTRARRTTARKRSG
jgi:hypothetical protein